MNLLSGLTLFMAGITSYVGVSHLWLYARRPHERQNLTFALTSLGVGLYDLCCSGLYSSQSPAVGAGWQRAQFIALALIGAAALWFVMDFAGRRPGWFGWLLTIGFGLSALFALVDRSDLTWLLDRPMVKVIPLPWGKSVTYFEVAPGALASLQSALGVALMGYMLWVALGVYWSGQRKKGRALLWIVGLSFAAVLNDTAVYQGWYRSLYLFEFAYLGVVLLMTQVLTGEVVEAAATREALAESEGKYRNLVERANDGIVILKEGLVAFANQRLAALYGEPVETILDTPFIDYVHPDERSRIMALYQKRINGQPVAGIYETVLLTRAGESVAVEINAGLTTFEGQTADLVVVRDIRDRKQAEQALQESEVKHRLLLNSIRWPVLALRPDMTILYCNDAYARFVGRPQAELEGHDLVALFPSFAATNSYDAILRVLETGEPQQAEGPVGSRQLRAWVYPTPWGALSLAEDITDRKDVEEALRQRNRELALLHRAGQAFGSTLDLDQVLVFVLEEVRSLLGVIACSVWLADRAQGGLVCRQAAGPKSEQVRGWRLEPGQGIAGWVAGHGESLIVADTLQDTRHFDQVARRLGLSVRSVLCIPLMIKRDVIGVLQVLAEDPNRFDASHVALLEPLAAAASTAVENARLYEQAQQEIRERRRAEVELRERATRLELIAQIGRRTTALLDLDELLRQSVDLIGETFQYYSVGILLVDGEEIVLRATLRESMKAELHRLRLRIGQEGITGWVAGSGESWLVPNVDEEPRHYRTPHERRAQSELAVPILFQGIVIGVLDVQSTERGGLSDADLFILQTVADQLAVAIENARLYAQIQQHAADLEARVAARTAELEAVNRELEAFAYSVSHDLRAPLRSVDGFARALAEDYAGQLDNTGHDFLRRLLLAAERMRQLIDDLLKLSRLTRGEMHREPVDLSVLAETILSDLVATEPTRQVAVDIAPGLTVRGDARLLRVALENLLGNAWKFTGKKEQSRIEFGCQHGDGQEVFFVRDDGVGFDMAFADRLFGAFQRLHSAEEFDGVGIGLATVQRIVHRHGGRVWAEGTVGQGATFFFTLSH